MAKIEVYGADYCPFCHRAKALLRKRGMSFEEFDVVAKPALREEMQSRGGAHTVPQIFIDGNPIGGCDELMAMDRRGQLAELAS